MKKIVPFLCLSLVATIFVSCNNHQEELDAAIKQNDSLSMIISTKDAELDSLFSTLNEI